MPALKADLHLHSVWSDGAFSPAELARRCKEAGLALFSVTDHDNMGGAEEGARAAKRYGLLFVRGWEVSSYKGGSKVHVLGYGCKQGEAYRAFSDKRKEGGLLRAEDMLAKANAHFGLALTMEDVERFHLKKGSPVHTMHVVSAFAESLGAERGALYRAAFARGGPAFSSLCRPTPSEAVEVIHETGGVAVLAHPGRIAEEERGEILAELAANGLDGLECLYTTHTAAQTEAFLAFAKERGLLVTGGSDFHCPDGRHTVGKPDYYADERLLERLF